MSTSVGQVVGGGGGAVAGFFLGGPYGAALGAQISMEVGCIIDAPAEIEPRRDSATDDDGDSPT